MSRLTHDAIVRALAEAAGRWRKPADPRRRLAVEALTAQTGLAPAMLHEGFDHHFAGYEPEMLAQLTAEASAGVDGAQAAGTCLAGRQAAVWLLIAAGNVPGLAVPDMAAVLLSGSSCRVRPSSNDPLTPVLFLETLLELEPRLADRLSVVRWPRHDAAVTHAAASAADGVVASGDDETIDAIAPHARRLIGYGHRRSVALIGAGALADADALADRLARDVCFYEQQGCLSPHVVYVEEGGAVPPIEFARRLARALELMAKHWPPAPIPLEAAGVILQLQAELEFQEAIGAQALSTNGGTVLYDPDPAPRPSPGYRTIWLKPVGQIDHALDALQTWQGRIESAGIALAGERVDAIRPRLDRLGVNRLCEIGAMQTPPLRWRLIDQGLLPQLFRWNAVCSAATS